MPCVRTSTLPATLKAFEFWREIWGEFGAVEKKLAGGGGGFTFCAKFWLEILAEFGFESSSKICPVIELKFICAF